MANSSLIDVLSDTGILEHISKPEIALLMGELERIRALLFSRLFDPNPSVENSDTHEKLIAVEEAARILNLTEQYVYELMRRGEIPSVRIGKYRRIRQKDLESWISGRTECRMEGALYEPYSHPYERQRAEKAPRAAGMDSGSARRSNRSPG